VTQRDPLNPNPVAPHLVIAPLKVANPDYDVVSGEVVGEPVDEITDWFNTNRQHLAENPPSAMPPQPNHQPAVHYDQGYQQYPAPQQQAYPNQQQPQQNSQPESVFGQLLRKGVDAAKLYIEDPDGKRMAARQAREEAARLREEREDARVQRELAKELLIQRKKRNRGW
jgi:hypothetical protein